MHALYSHHSLVLNLRWAQAASPSGVRLLTGRNSRLKHQTVINLAIVPLWRCSGYFRILLELMRKHRLAGQ